MKYANYIILFLLLSVGFLFKDYIHVSTNLLSLFASKDAIEKLAVADKLGYSKEMLIAVKGFDKASKKSVKSIVKELENLNAVESVTATIVPAQEVKEYYREYHSLLADFDATPQSKESIHKALVKLYDAQLTNIFYAPINKNDPLELFTMPKKEALAHRGKYITLGEYGYLIRVKTKVDASQMKEAKILYSEVQSILKKEPNATAFAPFFYTVENSTKIKDDVTWIVVLSTLILLLIYLVMLRDVKLLRHTLILLGSSMIFATLVTTTSIENFSVLSLAFGVTLSAVSVDYLFHYYFHGFFHSGKKFDRSVFFGFMTTITAFGIFSFIPVPMISQISIFASLALSFAYVVFTFVFPYLDIKESFITTSPDSEAKKIPSAIFTLLSLALLTYSALTLKFDENIRNLDYQNIKLQEAQKLFEGANSKKLYPVIVQASNQKELLKNLHILEEKSPSSLSFASFVQDEKVCEAKKAKLQSYDFKRLNTSINEQAELIGFKEGYFKDAYRFTLPSCTNINLSIFNSFNLSTFKDANAIYTIAMVEDIKRASTLEAVSTIDVKAMFARVAQQMFSDIKTYSSVVLVVIFALLLLSVRGRFFYALNYILFPLSITLAIVATLYPLNIMHLFSLIILMAIGIDYGIYMSSTSQASTTQLAIKYSLLSTFAAFGVLLFSSITALYSIGIVISVGVGAIYLLTRLMR